MTRDYIDFIRTLKRNILQSRYIATRLANREQLLLYYKTGIMLTQKIEASKWGSKMLDHIAKDLQAQLPGLRGFSGSNLKKMRIFAETYSELLQIGSATTNQLNKERLKPSEAFGSLLPNQMSPEQFLEVFFSVSFTHHFVILSKVKGWDARLFYLTNTAHYYWPVTNLEHQIRSDYHKHAGKLPSNFASTLPENLKPSAFDVFKDEYLFDFITTNEDTAERSIENQLVSNIKNAIMSLGKGFAFIGNQYRLDVEGHEFFVDLLFYNRHLNCLVAFELKTGKFKPEYAGQLNFYLNVLDEHVKLSHENPSIGIILCKEKNNTVVEFAFKNLGKGMGA